MKRIAVILLLSPLLASAVSVRGQFGAPDIGLVHDVSARLISIAPVLEIYTSSVNQDGRFEFSSVKPGSYILEGKIGATRIFFRVVAVVEGQDTDVGSFINKSLICSPPSCFADDFGLISQRKPPPPDILDVCDGLQNLAKLSRDVVIVGILQETAGRRALLGHCATQLSSGGYSWMNSIGLPDLLETNVPDLAELPFWETIREAEKRLNQKVASIRKSEGSRPSRVVVVYGSVGEQLAREEENWLKKEQCKRNTCTPQILFPPADFVVIKGLREIK